MRKKTHAAYMGRHFRILLGKAMLLIFGDRWALSLGVSGGVSIIWGKGVPANPGEAWGRVAGG